MRTAPPADYLVSRQGPWHHLGLLLVMLAAAAVAAWSASQLHLPVPLLALCALCGTGLLGWARQQARAIPVTRLRWDGLAWRLMVVSDQDAASPPGVVRVVMDVGDGLLLRWTEVGSRRASLLPLWRAQDQAPAWHALRVAVHASRSLAP